MKKRMYRAVAVKGFDWKWFHESVHRESRLVIGLDVAKHKMFAVAMNEQQEILACWKWDHLSESRWMCHQLGRLPVDHVEVALEPSGTYGDALIQCLLDVGGLSVHRIHPKQAKDASELYDGVPSSHDAKASAILAWLHLLGRSTPWRLPEQQERCLASLLQLRELHSRSFLQALNLLEAQLARHWPELPELLQLDSACLLELVSRYGDPKAVLAQSEQARDLLIQVGHHGLSSEKIDKVLRSAQWTLGVRPIEPERQALKALATEARRRQLAKQSVDRQIRAVVREEPMLARLGEVVGLVTAACLVRDLGPLTLYPNTGSLLKAAGLNLKERSSGTRQGQLALTKRGSGRVRQCLFLAVLRWVRDDPWARAWHQGKVQRDGGKLKLKSLVALMRKLLRGLWWVAGGEVFNSQKLFDCRRLAAVGASAD